jgi:hypothetical protein
MAFPSRLPQLYIAMIHIPDLADCSVTILADKPDFT